MTDIRVLTGALIAAINAHDADDVVTFYAPDAVIVSPLGMAEGREQIHWYFQQLFLAFPDIHDAPQREDVAADTVVAEWTVTATHAGPLLLPGGTEIEPTGRRITWSAVAVSIIENDMIVTSRIYYDQWALYRQLGHGIRLSRTT